MKALFYKGEDIVLTFTSTTDMSGYTKVVKYFTPLSAVKTATVTAVNGTTFTAKMVKADTADLKPGRLNVVLELTDGSSNKQISKTIDCKLADAYQDGSEREANELTADIAFLPNGITLDVIVLGSSFAAESAASAAVATAAKTAAESANTSAQSAKTSAETANTSAQSAKTAAESARDIALGATSTAITETEAILLVKQHNHNYLFSGFVKTSTSTPTHAANKAYVCVESGTVLGITARKGQIIKDDGSSFVAENLKLMYDIVVLGKNIVNKTDPCVVIGGYYDETNVFNVSAGYNQSGFCHVVAGLNYCSTQKSVFALWYDAYFNYIGSTPGANAGTYVTAPANACFGRFIATTANWAALQVEQGTSNTDYEAYRGISTYLKSEYIPTTPLDKLPLIPYSKLAKLEIDITEVAFSQTGKNLLNPNDRNFVTGGYWDQNGAYNSDVNYVQSGFIKIDPSKNYTASYNSAFVVWYDEYKNILGETSSTSFAANGYVTPIAGSYYARFINVLSNLATWQVEQASAPTTYEAYRIAIKDSYLPAFAANLLNGEKITSYGDSITYFNLWQPYVASYFNLTHTALGVVSSTLALVPAYEATYPCFVNEARIQAIKDSDPDIVTILGGANDLARSVAIGTDSEFTAALNSKNKENFKGAYSFLIETLLTWKPSLEIIILSTMQSSNYDYNTYSDACRDVAYFYSLPFVDLNNGSGISKFNGAQYFSDGIHPNVAGAKRIASLVIDKLKSISNT